MRALRLVLSLTVLVATVPAYLVAGLFAGLALAAQTWRQHLAEVWR